MLALKTNKHLTINNLMQEFNCLSLNLVRLWTKQIARPIPAKYVLSLARFCVSHRSALAVKLLDNYLSGTGKDYQLCLDALLKKDSHVKQLIFQGIASQLMAGMSSGQIRIKQSHYSCTELLLALGEVCFSWTKDRDERISISFNKKYCWSPNQKRVSQAIHQAATRLEKQNSAKPFWLSSNSFYITSKELSSIRNVETKPKVEHKQATLHLL